MRQGKEGSQLRGRHQASYDHGCLEFSLMGSIQSTCLQVIILKGWWLWGVWVFIQQSPLVTSWQQLPKRAIPRTLDLPHEPEKHIEERKSSSTGMQGLAGGNGRCGKALVASVAMSQQLAPHPVSTTQTDGREENQRLVSTYYMLHTLHMS